MFFICLLKINQGNINFNNFIYLFIYLFKGKLNLMHNKIKYYLAYNKK